MGEHGADPLVPQTHSTADDTTATETKNQGSDGKGGFWGQWFGRQRDKDRGKERREIWKHEWEKMKKEGKSPAEFWRKRWDEMHTNGQFTKPKKIWTPDLEKKWNENVVEGGQSPKEFWQRHLKDSLENGELKEFGQWGSEWQQRWEDTKNGTTSQEEFWSKFWNETHQNGWHGDRDNNTPWRGHPRQGQQSPAWHKRFEDMKEKGKSPGEIWGTFWEETHFGSHGGTWRRLQKTWEDMKKEGKSPKEFWETVKTDGCHEQSPWSKEWKEQCEKMKKERKSPDELWDTFWEESQFGSHGGPWVAMQKKWENMKKEGKSPKDFWEQIKTDNEEGPWSEEWNNRRAEIQKGDTSPDQMWTKFWEESHFGGRDWPWGYVQKRREDGEKENNSPDDNMDTGNGESVGRGFRRRFWGIHRHPVQNQEDNDNVQTSGSDSQEPDSQNIKRSRESGEKFKWRGFGCRIWSRQKREKDVSTFYQEFDFIH